MNAAAHTMYEMSRTPKFPASPNTMTAIAFAKAP